MRRWMLEDGLQATPGALPRIRVGRTATCRVRFS